MVLWSVNFFTEYLHFSDAFKDEVDYSWMRCLIEDRLEVISKMAPWCWTKTIRWMWSLQQLRSRSFSEHSLNSQLQEKERAVTFLLSCYTLFIMMQE